MSLKWVGKIYGWQMLWSEHPSKSQSILLHNWRHRLFLPIPLPIILLSCHDKVEKSLFVLASGVRWEGPERTDTQTDIPTTNYNQWNTDGKLGSKHSQVAAEECQNMGFFNGSLTILWKSWKIKVFHSFIKFATLNPFLYLMSFFC